MRLIVKQNEHLVNQLHFVKGPIHIGRHAQCQIFLSANSVSRQHAVIFLGEGEQWLVKDLHSTNKTYLNDEVIDEASIKTGDRIKVGDYVIEVDLEKDRGTNKQAPLEDTHAPVSRGPQLITRTLDDVHAPAIRMPAHRVNDLQQILREVAHAGGYSETLKVLLEVLVCQFHAAHVWCSLRCDADGFTEEQGGRTDAGQPFELEGNALQKLIEEACDNRQFVLLSHIKQEVATGQGQSVIIVPIIANGGTLGVIYIDSRPGRPVFSMSDLDYAMIISINLGIILESF